MSTYLHSPPHFGGKRWAAISNRSEPLFSLTLNTEKTITGISMRGWCKECRAMRAVEEVDEDARITDSAHETHYRITWYSCGHQSAEETGRAALPF